MKFLGTQSPMYDIDEETQEKIVHGIYNEWLDSLPPCARESVIENHPFKGYWTAPHREWMEATYGVKLWLENCNGLKMVYMVDDKDKFLVAVIKYS